MLVCMRVYIFSSSIKEFIPAAKSLGSSFVKIPIFSYQVSGECAMLQFAAKNTDMDYTSIMLESLISFKRAGCDGILTYAAIDIAELVAPYSNDYF